MLRPHWNRITTRVLLLSALVSILLGATLVLLIVAIDGQRQAARAAYRSQEALTAGSQLEKSLIAIENGMRGYVASGRERFLAPANASIEGYPAELLRLESLVSSDAGQRSAVREIGESIDDYVTLWARPVIALARERLPAAQSAVVTNAGRQRLEVIRAKFQRLFTRERAVAKARESRAENRSDLAVGFGIGGLVFVLALVGGVSWYVRRTILNRLVRVADATGRLAQGDLNTRIADRHEDEIGGHARAFNAMADSLQSSQDDLESRTRELERSNHELEQFASVTSHDLQAPLATISMYAELFERRHGVQAGDGGKLIAGIRGATQQARELIRELLEFSRAGRGLPALEEVRVQEVVTLALQALAGPIETAHAEVTVGDMPVVMADRPNLARVFQNLVGNAVKFTPSGRTPQVTIDAERDGRFWRFSVADNGIGMDGEHAERIFQPFQRLHGEDEFSGTGLGLAVCERIIAQHGGRIWVGSRPGGGSIFHFTLPAAAVAQRDEAPPPEEPVRATV